MYYYVVIKQTCRMILEKVSLFKIEKYEKNKRGVGGRNVCERNIRFDKI